MPQVTCGLENCKKGKIKQDTKALQCEICEKWWHIDCADVDEDQYAMLNNGIVGTHWFCKSCNVGSAKILKIIGEMKKELSLCREELNKCKDEVAVLKKQAVEMKFNHDKLEQHGRKGMIRISGLKDPRTSDEDTDEKVIKLAADCGVELTRSDISVSHRLGKKDPSYDRAVIVKFVSRNTKRNLMMKKKLLKDKVGYGNVYINEDITTNRYKLVKHLRVTENKVAWTRDGKIYYKDNKDAVQINLIDTYMDLCKLNWSDEKLADIGIFQ